MTVIVIAGMVICLVLLQSHVSRSRKPLCTCEVSVLHCTENNITSLKELLENATCIGASSSISVYSNQLTTLDFPKGFLEKYSNATILAYDNKLTSLHGLEGWTGQVLQIQTNNIASIEHYTWLEDISHLDISDNKLSSLNLSSMNNLRKLEASKNYVTTLSLPNERCLIEELRLQFNKLSALPWTLKKCLSLVNLEIDNNNLDKLDVSANTKLKAINASNNNIRTLMIPKESCSLEKIDLNSNKLSTVPDTITQCSQLRLVDLTNNSLIKFPDPLLNLMKLRSDLPPIDVDVRNNPLTLLQLFPSFRDFVQKQGLFMHFLDNDFFTIKEGDCECSEMKLEHSTPVKYCATSMCDKGDNLWKYL